MHEGSGSAWYGFGLALLAVWRLTHLLHVEHGPWGAIAKCRAAARRLGLGELFSCFFCLSLWTAAPAAWWLTPGWPDRAITWLALSAGAILVETKALSGAVTPVGKEDGRDDMLR